MNAPITVGQVALSVANLDAALAFYQERIGLRVHRRQGDVAWLGVGGPNLLQLTEQRGARKALRTTGLYHFALLVPTRVDLALVLRHLAQTETVLGGLADHAVSEAIYLSDPDGHGIEIYRDWPRAQWQHPDGRLKLVTEPFDIDGVFGTLQETDRLWSGLPQGTVMGHIHLHVAHIPAVENFYGDVLGLEVMARYGAGASFMATGGYHHHLGLNTWNGVGASPPSPDSLRLQWYELLVDQDQLPGLLDRVQRAGVAMQQEGESWHLVDPSQNHIRLVPAPKHTPDKI